MNPYDHTKIEKKWQKYWESKKLFNAQDPGKSNAKKFYALIEFPYPSGDGLHVGHIKSNTAMDIISRKRRMEGYNVLYPIGWDAFGLPTENFAIKTGIQPAIVTKKNTDTFRRQLKALGFSFDWSREINTTDPKYYKWTQWIFLQLLKEGLAYKKKMDINWCPKDLIGLANEEVIDGKCERCGTPVVKKEKEQWMLAITKYAERLDKDLDETDFLEKIKIQQRNWIGKSEGAEITFKIIFDGGQQPGYIPVFTTRPDTLYGVTYIVLSPEHLWVTLATDDKHVGVLKNRDEVKQYIAEVKKKTDIERTAVDKEKTGVELKGVKAINPATGEEIPMWIADYVLADYGTGAVMAVPSHDERDGQFAQKYNLPAKQVIEPMTKRTVGEDALKANLPLSERNAVVCVIKHWSEDKYLGVRWKKNGWQGFCIGGIEGNETPVEAAMREIKEETGYQNIELERDLGGRVHSQFYHSIKNENRFAHFTPLLFKLKDGAHAEPADEEKALHDLIWLSSKEIENFITHSDIRTIWNRVKGIMTYTGDGLLIDSGKFSGKESTEIKKEITESVGGKWVTKFKLRDWIFSRQRYWGEPIPVVHCPKHGVVPLPESQLPLKLPTVKNYKPTETGESPLAAISKWVNTTCPTCVTDKKKPQYFIFDFDGVLGDTWKATVEARFAMGDFKTREESTANLMKYFENIPHTSRQFAKTSEEEESVLMWTRSFGENMLKHEINLFKEFITEIKKYKNAKMAVVSSGSEIYVKSTLKKSGLKFSHVLTYEDSRSKEEKIEKICGDWKIDVKDAHYFTDTKADVYELENLLDRNKIIGCAWGYHGFEKLKEVLLERQILKNFKDIHTYFNTDCKARRETDTMPNWAGSSWYYLRYTDPKNSKVFADKKKLDYWTPVDWYNGGMEHTTLHLLYSRFWHKFLFDIGAVPTKEPYQKRTSQGLILAAGGVKMSKSIGNVINPDTIVKTVGADALRLYEMFMGPFDQHIAWDENGIVGTRRFIEKVWRLQEKIGKGEFSDSHIHKTIKKVSEDIEAMRFNTAISSMMILVNEMEKATSVSTEHYQILLILLSPFAPHVAEELWQNLGNKKSILLAEWPTFDPSKIVESTMKIVVQVNGKTRSEFEIAPTASDDEVKNMALNMDEIKKWTENKDIKKVIVVKGRLVNIVA